MCISLCFVLWRSRTGVRRYVGFGTQFNPYSESEYSTDSLIRILVMYFINTSLLTTYVLRIICTLNCIHHHDHSTIALAALFISRVCSTHQSRHSHFALTSASVLFQSLQLRCHSNLRAHFSEYVFERDPSPKRAERLMKLHH